MHVNKNVIVFFSFFFFFFLMNSFNCHKVINAVEKSEEMSKID